MQQNISFSEFEGKTDQNKKKHLQTGVTTAFEKCPFVNRQADFSFIYIQLVSLFGKSDTEVRHSKLKCPPLVNAITNALNLQSLSPPLESVHKLFWFYTVSFMYIKTTHTLPIIYVFHVNHAVYLNTVAPNRKNTPYKGKSLTGSPFLKFGFFSQWRHLWSHSVPCVLCGCCCCSLFQPEKWWHAHAKSNVKSKLFHLLRLAVKPCVS